jgi:heme o synthase
MNALPGPTAAAIAGRVELAGRRANRLYVLLAVWLLLGAMAFVGQGPSRLVVIATVLALGCLAAWATVSERDGWRRGLRMRRAWDATAATAAAASIAVAAVVVAGAEVTSTSIGIAVAEPGQHVSALVHWSIAAGALPLLLVATSMVSRTRGHGSASAALASAGTALYLVEMVTGAATGSTVVPWMGAAHLWIGGASWACLAAATAAVIAWPVAQPSLDAATGATTIAASWWVRANAYIALTKPRIIELLLVTTVPAMLLAARDAPVAPATLLWLIVCTLVGGTLAAGSANAINCYLDRDIDQLMTRTQRRPLPAHAISPERALTFGLGLGVLAFALLVAFVNVLAAVLTLLAIAFYVVVYTFVLKRSTPQNIVIGGAAGALPPLIGWAAVRGDLGATPLLLFLIVFYWTPPHFWALSVRLLRDYASAGVPMLPVVRGIPETNRQILLYSILLVLLTVALLPIGSMGAIYLIGAATTGAWFLAEVWSVWRDGSGAGTIRLYRHSITYLGALFGFIALDAVLTIRI